MDRPLVRLMLMIRSIAIATTWAFATSSADADVIYLKDASRIFGLVDRQSDTHVFFKQRVGKEQYRERTFRHEEILTIVKTIDAPRLTALVPERPIDYFNYAEELAVARDDPEAHDLSFRLYLITASLADGELHESAMIGMIQSARSPIERQRCIALAWQLLGNRAQRWIQKPAEPAPAKPDVAALRELLNAIRKLRDRERAEATRLISDTAKSTMDLFRNICTWQELDDWSRQNKLSHAKLAKLLQLEISLTSVLGDQPDQAAQSEEAWGTLLKRDAGPVMLVDFSNISEFDVHHSIFRQGQWVSPSVK